MEFKYWHGGHAEHRLLITLFEYRSLEKEFSGGKVAKRIKKLLYKTCVVECWWIEEINILSDYIHMLVQVQQDGKISGAVNKLKGGTSRTLRKELPEVKEFILGNSFWTDGYFAETVGRKNMLEIKKYIKGNTEIMPQEKRNHDL